jgi:3-oxoacyl-[acyl-carrier-protein] synthase-3
MSVMRAVPLGCGHYLPARIVENAEFAASLDTSDEWIRTRTGIERRHFAADGEMTSDLATAAARAALADSGLTGADIDAVIVATATPDLTFPATAAKVQSGIGMRSGFAFDMQAVCAGFVFALSVADNFIKTGQAKTALVVGSETFSRILDWDDRGTCVLFGDGAGAVVLASGTGDGVERGASGWGQAPGILSTHLHSDGRLGDILYVDGGPSSTKTVGHLRMAGKEVFRHAVANLAAVAQEAVAANGFTMEDVDWVVPHQANIRILEGISRKLGLPQGRLVITVDHHANTSAASIPLALDEAVSDGRIKRGDLVLFEAIGGGMAWGAALVRW